MAVSAGIFFVIVIFCIGVLESTPPSGFPNNQIVSIPKNTGLSQAADILLQHDVIRSAFLYKAWSVVMGGRHSILAGDYLFSQPQSVIKVAWRIVKGQQDLPRIKVTVPEGLNVSEISTIFSKSLPDFNVTQFTALAKPDEGYLFPDTYFFYQNVQPRQIVDTMKVEFDQKFF